MVFIILAISIESLYWYLKLNFIAVYVSGHNLKATYSSKTSQEKAKIGTIASKSNFFKNSVI
jgi:hypothetical protein